MKITERLEKQILLMDGAFGTYFRVRHFGTEEAVCPEKAVFTHRDWVKEIHKEYIEAGADIIRTNTFELNEKLCGSREEAKRFITEAVDIAREAIEESHKEVYLAGTIGPKKYSNEEEEKKVYLEYLNIIDLMLEREVTHFIFETFFDVDMAIKLAAYVKKKNPDCFVLVQMVFNKMGFTKYGYNMQRLVDTLSEEPNIDAFGFNCGIGAAHMSDLFEKVRFHRECNISVVPNAGYQQELMGRNMYFHNSEYYTGYVRKMVEKGANIIGGCCGTSPSYIRELRKYIDSNPNPRQKKIYRQESEESYSVEKNPFIEKLNRGEKVFVVELDAPFGKSADKFIESAFRLKENQVDLVTISDSPMAKARADAFTTAIYVQNKTGLTMMPHIACRDRNAVAVHGAFLGAHINDIRNILIITGDPLAREDRNMITPVFDFNSIKLMQYLKNMNEQIFKEEPFYYGGALNYAGGNIQAIVAKMKRKMEAGCSYFLTQPIYSEEDIMRVYQLKELSGAKIICGLMPLVSRKNAVFMQNEMPGIHVPEEIVERYRTDMTREEAEHTAAEICVEIGKRMNDFADGYYIMTPFNRVGLVNQIIQQLREQP